VPILGETGCRIAEVIGLRREDVASDASYINVLAHSARSLKTSGSERDIPLVGYAQKAMKRLLEKGNDDYLFSEYLRDGTILATHAGVISPFLAGCGRRTYAAIFSFMAGVMPPMPMLGRSLL
jgi:integrase